MKLATPHTQEARLSAAAKVSQSLAKSGWDGLLVLGGESVQYCSAIWVPNLHFHLDRPNIVFVPTGGEPVFITGLEGLAGLHPPTPNTKLVSYDDRGAVPPAIMVDTVADVIRQEGLERAVLGLVMLRTSVAFYRRLRELLPNARFEPADDLLRRLRMVKTQDEIEALTAAAQLTDEGIWRAFQASRAAQTEREIAVAIQLQVLERGADLVTSQLVGAGEGARTLMRPTSRSLQPGDIVRLDLSCNWDGYFVDLGRMAVVGEASEMQRKDYQAQLELRSRVIDFLRPGVTAAEVHATYLEEAARLDVELFIYPYLGLGHGLGVNVHEEPTLNGSDQTVLEPGMVLNLEPDTIGSNGEIFHVEDAVVVTEDGAELISESRDWSELVAISA